MAPNITQTGCAIQLGDPAVNMVALAYDKYTQFATEAYKLARDEISSLDGFQITPVKFNVGFNFNEDLFSIKLPPAPAEPKDLTFRDPGTLPDAPSIALTPFAFDPVPTAPVNPLPALRNYTEPAPLSAQPPSDTVALAPVPTSVRPTLVLPDVPVLDSLNLPTLPTITFEPFTAKKPDISSIEAPLETFAFTPEKYTSDLLNRVKTRVGSMLDGGTGLPANVAQALRDRAFSAVDAEEERATQQAVDEYAARGFSEPSGLLNKRLSMVRQNSQNERNKLSRDIHIQDQQIAIENLRFAVTEGVALESRMMEDHAEFMRVSLATAQAVQDVRIRIFDARVSLATLDLQAYQTEAQVWREQLQGKLLELEKYRAQLEGERLKGTLNEQKVRVYNAQLAGVQSLIDMYKADVQAASAVIEQNNSQIQLQRSRIEAYAERVNAYKTEWDAFRSKLESNNTRAQLYGLVEQGYATRIQAWGNAQDQKVRRSQLEIDQNKLRLDSWQTQRDKLLADLEAEKTRLTATADIYRTRLGVYETSARVQGIASDANLRKVSVGLEAERARVDTQLKNTELAINQVVELGRVIVAKLQGIAQTSTQLAASSMSAVNFSAGVHSGRSESSSCGTSFSYSGSLDDTTPLV